MKKFEAILKAVMALVAIVLTALGAIGSSDAPTGTISPVHTINGSDSGPFSPCYIEVEISGAIGPATHDLLERSDKRMLAKKCEARLLLINTPGGSLPSTRMIVEGILNASYPTLCLVYPSGAHAGSAGAIILQACHTAGAMAATNIGAASPVSGSGTEMPEDLRKKIFNDTRSWVEGLAKLRSRNEEFAKDIVDDAKSVSAEEALKIGAIDYVAKDKDDFIAFARTRDFKVGETEKVKLKLEVAAPMPLDLRYKIMHLLMSPEVAYMIFMGSLALLYFELTHPGTIAPGVVGGIGLIISLISLNMLEVQWGAVALILVGIGLLLAEVFVAGFGILGLGGIISFFVGSLFLFDPADAGHSLSLSVILPTTILLGGVMLFVAYLAFTGRKRKQLRGKNEFIGEIGEVTFVDELDLKRGFINIEGERWKVQCDSELAVHDEVIVEEVRGLTLMVKKTNKEKL